MLATVRLPSRPDPAFHGRENITGANMLRFAPPTFAEAQKLSLRSYCLQCNIDRQESGRLAKNSECKSIPNWRIFRPSKLQIC